ncbi:transporter substrate-binding domain-containing protein [Sporomusa sp. KB1]|jgi:ABC-type branched-subunit amino acid transport system substrate-binding protein|uniref:transporter substrate-binding domain-containing protein n=1 Tax=Sporomusa sp. KB1 TaxID=943346 RepID=UPI00119EE93F|nr:transporter substrate-binding domain-containing protein [Sporomusa sp. KB1]TWH46532.1 branched-chain amino acid transport system substrate-binding protein/urea transport system substrate-binding protein [Sporomusa sp. KB1]
MNLSKKWLALCFIVAMAALSLTGCSNSSKGSDAASKEEGIKIGVLYSTTGPFSISEKPMLNATKLAIEEINAAGGIKGKKLIPVYEDYASDPAKATEKIKKLILQDKVVATIGTNSSASRLAAIPEVERNNSVLVYNTYYEGEKPSPNVIYTNTVPSQQIAEYMPWIVKNIGKRVMFVGSDYIFPVNSIKKAKAMLIQAGGEVVGEEYVPLGHTEFSSLINKIKQAKPDVVFSAIAGDSVVPFYKQYQQYGISAKEIPICSIATHEATVKGIGAAAAAGHYSSFDYFQVIDTPESKKFIEAYNKAFNDNTTVTNLAEGAYHGVYLLAKALEKASAYDGKTLISAFKGLELDSPQGKIKVDETNNHTWLQSRIARIKEDGTFEIVYSSKDLVKPEL